jgi:hypothetical protein
MLNISPFSSPSFSAKGSNFTSRRTRWSSLAKSSIGAAVAAGVLTAGQAQALVVNVDGQDWDLTTFTGSYNANTSKFATAANGGVMPWWGSGSIAYKFASKVNNGLGLVNNGTYGPFFGFRITSSDVGVEEVHLVLYSSAVGEGGFGVGLWYMITSQLNSARTWAQATQYTAPSAPAPSPLPLFGAAAAFGFSRQLRKRIKGSISAVSGSFSL